MDKLEEIQANVADAMKLRGLAWVDYPRSEAITAESTAGAQSRMISGRILCEATGHEELVGPYKDEALFWYEALRVISNTDWAS